MLTDLDHIVIGVKELPQAMADFQRLGFHTYPGGEHPGRGTHNAVVLFDLEYFGLIAPQDTALPGGRALAETLERSGEGIRTFVVGSDSLELDMAAVQGRGVELRPIEEHERQTPGGLHLQWGAANLGPANPLPLYFIQHRTPPEERRRQAPSAAPHPNGALGIRGVAIVVEHLAEATARYHQVLGISPGPPHAALALGGVATVFNYATTQVILVEPSERPGPAREALARRGPGPFLALLRSQSAAATTRWLVEHDLPVYSQGRLPAGPRYVTCRPEAAHGAWLQWVE
ncbi:MAG: VOC family protein [Chloroflexi bacterium]|nr:VOC family protein [Chloroflexota bacterium]